MGVIFKGIRGQAPDSEGGVIWTRYSGGSIFLAFCWRGIDFLTSKGGYPLDSFTRISKIFQNFQARGGLFGFLAQIFLKGGEYFAKESPS